MYGSFKKKCEALISILNAFDLENVSSWLGKLSHPPTRLLQKKKNHQLQHTITSETMTTFANKMGWRLFESIWGRKELAQHYSHLHPSLISILQNAHAFDGYQRGYSDLMNIWI